jgi:shikimate dehydrogenase
MGTVRVGVVGWPVAHSRSPAIFGHWFDRHAIAARYDRIAVPPEEADEFFAGLPDDLHGCNVTIPHKAVAARHAERRDAAERLGVANTLWREGGRLLATSSDGEGFLRSLDAARPEWGAIPGTAVVLGAGGAAIAIADALAARGARVVVVNRTADKAETIAAATGGAAAAWEALPDALADAGLLVNATSLGMVGQPPLSVDLSPLDRRATVADIVYTPLETPLLAAARARGIAAVDGLGMLLHQATVGFEKWFGIRPTVDEALRRAVLATV